MLVRWPEVSIKTNAYAVVNGLGKHALFTNLIEDLSKKDDNKISIISLNPELFQYHPKVQNSIPMSWLKEKPWLKDYISKIYFTEPYSNDYNFEDQHIINNWREHLGLETTELTTCDIYTDEKSKQYTQDVLKSVDKPFIFLQLKGGTHVSQDQPRPHFDERGMLDEDIDELIHALIKEFGKKYMFFILRTKLDYYSEKTIQHPGVATIEDEYTLAIIETIKQCKAFVGIDSCLQHFASNRHKIKKGVVLWGQSTKPTMIGHDHNINIRSEKVSSVYVNPKAIIEGLKELNV